MPIFKHITSCIQRNKNFWRKLKSISKKPLFGGVSLHLLFFALLHQKTDFCKRKPFNLIYAPKVKTQEMSSVISYLSSLASSYEVDFDRDNLNFQTKDLANFQGFAAELFIYAATNHAFSSAYKIKNGQEGDVSWITLIAKPGTPRSNEEPLGTNVSGTNVSGTNVCTEVSNDRVNIAHIKEMTGNDGFGSLREKVGIEPEIAPFPSPAKKARDFYNETRIRTLREKWSMLGECELKNILDREWKHRKTLFDESLIQSLQKLAKEDRKRFKAEKKEWKKYQNFLREQHAQKFGRESEDRVSRRKSPARRRRNAPERRNIYYVVSVSLSKEVEVDLFRKKKHAEKFAEYLCGQDCVFDIVSVGSGEIHRKFSTLDV